MNKKSLILAASALALVLSCNVKEDVLPLAQKVTFQAVLCDTPPTKTALQSNGAVYWTTGDAINIFYKDNISAKFASDSTATAASAQTSFSGVLEDLVPNGSDYFWAVYPYSGSTTYDGSSVTVTLPSEQYGTAGTFADDLFISMARSMDYTLQFYNLCGGIKFRVANQGIRLVTFAGNNSEILAGQVQATFNSEGKPVVLENLKGATTLRLHSPDDDGFEVGKWYYIVSLPATLSAGYTMTFYNASNEEIAKRVTDTSVSIKRSIWGRLTDADVVAAPENHIIRYTTSDAATIDYYTHPNYPVDFTLVSNVYENGEGVMTFDGPVTRISYMAFSGNSTLTSIVIPDSVTSIDEGAFTNCSNLAWPEIPSSVTSIGDSAFFGCSAFTNVIIPDSVTGFGNSIFQNCQNLQSISGQYASADGRCLIIDGELNSFAYAGLGGEYVFPQGVTAVGQSALRNNHYSGALSFASDITSIGKQSFAYAYYIKSVAVGNSLTAINEDAFISCGADSLILPSTLTTVGNGALAGSFDFVTLRSTTPPTASGPMFESGSFTTTFPVYVPAESLDAYKTAEYWSAYADRIQAIPVPVNPSKYLTFTSTGSTTISLTNEGGNAPVLYYSTDAQNWTQWDYSGLTFTEAAPLYLCGDNPEGFGTAYDKYSTFVAEGSSFAVSGDIMSLISMNSDVLTIPSNYCFASLFKNCTGLTAAPSLSATSFVGTSNCYDSMFSGCVGLVSAPELPATELGENCYEEMFRGCTGLTTAPALPATELTSGCYWGMFWDCTALASAPELSAVTMASACYAWMFSDCTSLEEMPDLPATTLASQCYRGMFYGCTGLVSAIPSLPASTLSEWCYAEMFAYCSNLSTAPYLDAPVLAENCYKEMFKGCTSLEYLRCLATNNSATGCTDSWLDSASTSGYFIKDASMTDWPQGTSGIPSGWTVQNSDGSPLMTASKYLTLTSTGSSEVYVDNSGSNAPVLYYSYNLIDWILWEDYSNLPFTSNRPIYICGVNPEGFSVNQSSRSTIKFSGDYYAVSGDIMSLIDKDEDVVEIPSDYCFYYLFNSDLNMTSGPSLTATTLRPHCYEGMFSSCFALTVAPELPSMELTESCYAYMFSSCSGLLTAPELPATTLAANCYYDMFYYCTSMKSAPATLPATVLAQGCYSRMFESCHSIASGPSLPATSLADQCYMAMFTDCRGLVEAPALPADTLATSCYHSMFAGCTSLTVAPDLPAENLTESCYEQMFVNCSGLTTAQAILPSTTLASACYQAMFSGCSSLSTAPELPAPVVATNAYNTMFNQCTSLNFVKCMAYDISASSCVSLWMNNVAATGTFVKTANSQWPTGESGIPEGWTVEIGD